MELEDEPTQRESGERAIVAREFEKRHGSDEERPRWRMKTARAAHRSASFQRRIFEAEAKW
jgi:hypothetical protein